MSGTDRFFTVVFLTLTFSGLFNYAFSSVGMVFWKQLLICVLTALAFVRSGSLKDQLAIIGVAAGIGLLVVSSIINLVPVTDTLRASFFYIAWLPFLLWGKAGGLERLSTRYALVLLIALIIGAVGMFADLKTGFASAWFKVDQESFEFASESGEVRRVYFAFVASTLVLPMLAGLAVIALRTRGQPWVLPLTIVCLAIAALCAGSTSALVFAAVVSAALIVQRFELRRALLPAALVLLAGSAAGIGGLSFSSGEDSTISTQLERITNNANPDSDANRGRMDYWLKAIEVISTYNLPEHLVGRGLGLGEASLETGKGLPHGESSFFQAYIEGGLLGLLLRLGPFVLFVASYRRWAHQADLGLVLYLFAFFISVAVAPTFGNIPSQAMLGLIVGHYLRKKRRTPTPLPASSTPPDSAPTPPLSRTANPQGFRPSPGLPAGARP